MKYRVTYMATDFSKKDANGGRSFNKNSVVNYLNSPRTKEKIKNKRLFGAVSHIWRDKYQEYLRDTENPSVGDQGDFLLANNAACNVIVDMNINDNKLYITIETTPTEAGLMLARLYNDDFDLPVSMSTELGMDDEEYYLDQIFGIDITNSPAFDTYISEKRRVDGDKNA